jgi:hypothetical protein
MAISGGLEELRIEDAAALREMWRWGLDVVCQLLKDFRCEHCSGNDRRAWFVCKGKDTVANERVQLLQANSP